MSAPKIDRTCASIQKAVFRRRRLPLVGELASRSLPPFQRQTARRCSSPAFRRSRNLAQSRPEALAAPDDCLAANPVILCVWRWLASPKPQRAMPEIGGGLSRRSQPPPIDAASALDDARPRAAAMRVTAQNTISLLTYPTRARSLPASRSTATGSRNARRYTAPNTIDQAPARSTVEVLARE